MGVRNSCNSQPGPIVQSYLFDKFLLVQMSHCGLLIVVSGHVLESLCIHCIWCSAKLHFGLSVVECIEFFRHVFYNFISTGKGSYLTTDGRIEMDASIMDGSTLNAGAVACIRNVANPIKVARLVMDRVLFLLY